MNFLSGAEISCPLAVLWRLFLQRTSEYFPGPSEVSVLDSCP